VSAKPPPVSLQREGGNPSARPWKLPWNGCFQGDVVKSAMDGAFWEYGSYAYLGRVFRVRIPDADAVPNSPHRTKRSAQFVNLRLGQWRGLWVAGAPELGRFF
jgi:hypothetical protein